jgi:hypothetical protein
MHFLALCYASKFLAKQHRVFSKLVQVQCGGLQGHAHFDSREGKVHNRPHLCRWRMAQGPSYLLTLCMHLLPLCLWLLFVMLVELAS